LVHYRKRNIQTVRAIKRILFELAFENYLYMPPYKCDFSDSLLVSFHISLQFWESSIRDWSWDHDSIGILDKDAKSTHG